jgi:DNA polymerase-3 subunit epsilon
LCKRLGVDNSHRQLHGALLDAELLTDVYLAMTAGQGDLGLTSAPIQVAAARSASVQRARLALRVCLASVEEIAAHAARLDAIDRASRGQCRWRAG